MTAAATQVHDALSLNERETVHGHALSHISQTREKTPRFLVLREVVVTGIGAMLANCDSRETLWQQLSRGETQLKMESNSQGTIAVGRIHDFDCKRYLPEIPSRYYAKASREHQLYLASLAQAARDAGLDIEWLRGRPVGLFDGTSRGCFTYWYELIKSKLSEPSSRFSLRELSPGMPGQAVGMAAAVFGLTGPSFTFNGTCAAGAIAIGNAFRELQTGRTEVALATGHDSALIDPIFEMYGDAGLLSTNVEDASRAISPFSGHNGNAFGEGAVTLVLETREHAEQRGARVLAEVVGFRHANTGQHPTDVDFSAVRSSEIIEEVLKEAESGAQEVDFVVGHGNGVRTSDISELNYMSRVFGARTRQVPLLSTKPVYGHTLGASTALNTAAACMMLERDYVIPTVGVDDSRTVRGFCHQANVGEAKALNSGLVVGYGIGGQNVALLLRKAT